MTWEEKVEALLKALAATQRELELAKNVGNYYQSQCRELEEKLNDYKKLAANTPNGSEK